MKRSLPVIPRMTCDTGCGDCCGPVQVSRAELDAVLAEASRLGVTPKSQGLTCPFFQNGACSVYAARPLLCQIFGHVDRLECPRGRTVLAKVGDQRKLVRALHSGRSGALFLHHALGPAVDVTRLVTAVNAIIASVAK